MAVVIAGIWAGIIAVAALDAHYRKKREQALGAEVARTVTRATRATHGSEERADQGDEVGVGERFASPYLQVAVAGLPIITASAEEVVPVGLPVAASEEMVTVVTGSWAPAYPASGGSWAPASGGAAAAESGAGLVVVTGLVLPNSE